MLMDVGQQTEYKRASEGAGLKIHIIQASKFQHVSV
jgi:hypothetical protein